MTAEQSVAKQERDLAHVREIAAQRKQSHIERLEMTGRTGRIAGPNAQMWSAIHDSEERAWREAETAVEQVASGVYGPEAYRVLSTGEDA